MKKQILLGTIIGAVVLSGGGFIVKSYAETGSDQPAAIEQQTVPVQDIIPPVVVEDNFVPILFGNEMQKNTSLSINVMEQTNPIAEKLPNNELRISTSYMLQDEVLVDFAQNASEKDMTIDQIIEAFKERYPSDMNTVKDIEINGQKGLVVENEVRKVVHVFTDNHTFTISSASQNANLEDLLEISKQIKE